MGKKILIAYASRYGSTAEVAGVIGGVLREEGHDVEVKSVKDVKVVGVYQAIIIGSSARVFRLLPEAIGFARRNKSARRAARFVYTHHVKLRPQTIPVLEG